jgi:hypothetical protein
MAANILYAKLGVRSWELGITLVQKIGFLPN